MLREHGSMLIEKMSLSHPKAWRMLRVPAVTNPVEIEDIGKLWPSWQRLKLAIAMSSVHGIVQFQHLSNRFNAGS